jgi:hypothetical protein
VCSLAVPNRIADFGSYSLLNKYRDFEHAEHLYYPFDICRSLAALLKESSGAYPEGHQVKGLDVGWLVRA